MKSTVAATESRMKAAYLPQEQRRRKPGSYWFSGGAMRFFGTKVESVQTDIHAPTVVFITSEEPPSGGRWFSVRIMDHRGQIETFGPFSSMDRETAEDWAEYAVREGITADEAAAGSLVVRCLRDPNMDQETVDYWADRVGVKADADAQTIVLGETKYTVDEYAVRLRLDPPYDHWMWHGQP